MEKEMKYGVYIDVSHWLPAAGFNTRHQAFAEMLAAGDLTGTHYIVKSLDGEEIYTEIPEDSFKAARKTANEKLLRWANG